MAISHAVDREAGGTPDICLQNRINSTNTLFVKLQEMHYTYTKKSSVFPFSPIFFSFFSIIKPWSH